MKHGFRRPQKNGWTFVHLEGEPADIGFQHGYLLASEIDDMLKVTRSKRRMTGRRIGNFFEMQREL